MKTFNQFFKESPFVTGLTKRNKPQKDQLVRSFGTIKGRKTSVKLFKDKKGAMTGVLIFGDKEIDVKELDFPDPKFLLKMKKDELVKIIDKLQKSGAL